LGKQIAVKGQKKKKKDERGERRLEIPTSK
jgi:hypothetical protein